ncbi:MAG: class III signal peptide-containing protein [Candidatus Omnitrophica bacterium]|nr:class III signal peptide-containing protein [Candidatus Omnitrophota bacterium]
MFIRLNKKGQGTLEYGVIIAVVVAGLIFMQTYVKQGVQGKLKQSADEIGEQYSEHSTGTITTISNVNTEENTTGGDRPVTTSSSTQHQTRSSTENITVSDQEE